MKNIKLALSPFAILLIVSCVTINVYFPAAAAQEAAQEIVNEVLKQNEQPENKQPSSQQQQKIKEPTNPDRSSHHSHHRLTFADKLLDFVIPVAHAAANISINTPKIRSLRNKLKQQHGKLTTYFNKGSIGYSDNGLIKIRNSSGLNIRQKSTMKKLVNSTNGILTSLYSEIAKENGHPEWKADIQKTFAKTWISEMQGGWMYYSGGKWKKK